MSVQLAKNVDVNKLKYSEVKVLTSGAKSVYINYGSEKLNIQTPVMSLPYGLGVPFESKDAAKTDIVLSADKKFDLTLSFRGMEDNPKIRSFYDKLKEIEAKIIDDAFTNRVAWFQDDYDGNKSFVARLFTPIIKIDKDKTTGKLVGKYPPTFKAKLPYNTKDDTFAFDCYDMENNELDFASIMKKLKSAKIQGIIQLTGLWFAGGKYGCSWKFNSAKFQLVQSYKMTFLEDSDTENIKDEIDETEEEDIAVDTEAIKAPHPQEEDEENISEGYGEGDEDNSQQSVAPPPPPAKKVASRKGK
jgi:hypothetical protein